jgi:hypothetical protein
LADAWHYGYTDFGEGHGRSPQPVLRAAVGIATPGAPNRFAAIIDTGGPITVVAAEGCTPAAIRPNAARP